jgi:CDP-diacylglycerol--serine O-phosphatidyltransferase
MNGAGMLLRLLAQVLYLFAPLLLSAAISGLVMRRNWLQALYVPIDSGVELWNQPLFGRSKTWRGFVLAVFGCILGAACQRYLLASWMEPIALLDYSQLDVVAFGTAMGAGAMLGELPNSFVKRRHGIGAGMTARGAPAAVFYVWDQIDMLTVA